LKLQLFPHPAYSPYPTPYDYHIFGMLRDVLQCYVDADLQIMGSMTWFHAELKTFITDGIRKLMDQTTNV
jgi:hypothetical protein